MRENQFVEFIQRLIAYNVLIIVYNTSNFIKKNWVNFLFYNFYENFNLLKFNLNCYFNIILLYTTIKGKKEDKNKIVILLSIIIFPCTTKHKNLVLLPNTVKQISKQLYYSS